MTMPAKVAFAAALLAAGSALGHGDVAPQPVNTDALPDVGEDWATENPYRGADHDVWAKAVEIGASGYTQNCARCHGLEVVSGGLAPDLRYLEADEFGDEWFLERFRHGYTQDGITKMPAFGDLLGQKAAWAIRTYIETRPDDGAIDAHKDRLGEIRDLFTDFAVKLQSGTAAYDAVAAQVDQAKAELETIAAEISTASGAPVADSAASRAARAIDGKGTGVIAAAETLTIGLSAAK
jgi:cytochrome c-550 PedF